MRLSKEQRKKLLIGLALMLLLGFLLRMISFLSGKEAESSGSDDRAGIIPDAEESPIEPSKIEAYSNAERLWSANEIYADMEESDPYSDPPDTREIKSVSEEQAYDKIVERNTPVRKESGPGGHREGTAAREEGYREKRMRQYYDKTSSAITKGEAEKDSIMALSNGNDGAQSMDEAIGEKVSARRSSVISSLDCQYDDISSSGFSSLSDDSDIAGQDDRYPFECMFVREEKLHDGSRVAIRLLEDMVIDGLTIPKNTHLMANCSIRDRLELTITSLERNQKIYALNYEAYDNDGGKGIYCPNLNEQAVRTAKGRGLSSIGSLITGRIGRVASSAVSTGISIAQTKSGEVTVTVPSGYKFFIVKAERKS